MSSTASMMRRVPGVFGAALFGSALSAVGLRNFVSSTRPWPSGVRIIAMSDRTPSSPMRLDLRLALQLQTEFLEESDRSCEVVHNNAGVVHPLSVMPLNI